MPDYPKDQIWEIYENLPQDLKEAVFSERTAEYIQSACENNGIEDLAEVSKVAKIVGQVLMGIIPPHELQPSIERELGIKPEKAKKMRFEIYRFVLFPVKKSLSELYEEEILPVAGEITPPPPREKAREKDTYRESIEESSKEE